MALKQGCNLGQPPGCLSLQWMPHQPPEFLDMEGALTYSLYSLPEAMPALPLILHKALWELFKETKRHIEYHFFSEGVLVP